jgi:hypothetical protein
MHFPVQIFQGVGVSHWKVIPARTTIIQNSTKTPITLDSNLCNVLRATRCKKRIAGHIDRLIARTRRIVDAKSFNCICPISATVRRHLLFPRPESTAVNIMTMLPNAHKAAAKKRTSSDSVE